MDYFYGKTVSNEFIDDKLVWDSNNAIKRSARKIGKSSDLKINKCPVCGTTKSKKFISFYGLNYLRCNKCTLIYADKGMSEKARLSFYSQDTDNLHFTPYASKKYLDTRKKIVGPKILFMKKYARGKNWLDVGTADGAAVEIINKNGFNGAGIEISKHLRDFAKRYRNLDLYPRPIEELAKENTKKWNVISFFGVFDILPNPMKTLRVCNKLLDKNGIIGLNIPNYESVSTAVQRLIKEPDRHLGYDIARAYSLKSIKYALQKAGFVPIAVWFFGMDTIEFLKYLIRHDPKFTNSELREILRSKINEIQYVFDKASMSDQILIIGRKKN